MRAAIVLAAGRSRRFGAANKLLAAFRGRPLIHHALAAARAATVGRVLVVVGRDPRLRAAIRAFDRDIDLVAPAGETAGPRESLAAGIAALRPRERQAYVFLADMPLVPVDLAARLTYRQRGRSAVRPAWRNRPGHPVLLRDVAAASRRLARGEPPFDLRDCARIGAERACLADIDTAGDLAALAR